MRIECPNCRRPLEVKDEHAGMSVKCPGCHLGFRVPQPGAAQAPPASSPQPGAAQAPPAASEQPSGGNTCPKCQSPLRDDAIICIACGLDLRTGKSVGAPRVLSRPDGAAAPSQGPPMHGTLSGRLCVTLAFLSLLVVGGLYAYIHLTKKQELKLPETGDIVFTMFSPGGDEMRPSPPTFVFEFAKLGWLAAGLASFFFLIRIFASRRWILILITPVLAAAVALNVWTYQQRAIFLSHTLLFDALNELKSLNLALKDFVEKKQAYPSSLIKLPPSEIEKVDDLAAFEYKPPAEDNPPETAVITTKAVLYQGKRFVLRKDGVIKLQ